LWEGGALNTGLLVRGESARAILKFFKEFLALLFAQAFQVRLQFTVLEIVMTD
jgi:hypothetical protein